MSKVMRENVVNPGQVRGTRWISHKQNALVALSKNCSALVAYFNDNEATGENRSALKIRGYLKKLCSYAFISNMAVFLDVLNVLGHFSIQLQKDNLNFSSPSDALTTAKKSLMALQA